MRLLLLAVICLSFKGAYTERWSQEAVNQELKYGIPAEISLAQAALETGWGRSRGVKYNAHFGIRAYRGEPHYVNADGKARMYKTPEDSWEDHSLLLCNEYQECFDCETIDCWAHRLAEKYLGHKRCQEDKDAYAQLLIKIASDTIVINRLNHERLKHFQ